MSKTVLNKVFHTAENFIIADVNTLETNSFD